MNNDEKIALIDKMFKKDDLLSTIRLINYEGFNFYIRLDYLKKTDEYRLSWIDLDSFNGHVNTEYVLEWQVLDCLTAFIKEEPVIPLKDYELKDTNRVLVNINSSNLLKYEFCDYIPEEYSILYDFFIFVFFNLPHKLIDFLYQLSAKLTGETEKYEYEKPKEFDLEKEDLSHIFSSKIIKEGTDYYQDNQVLFLEKIDNTFYAVVGKEMMYSVIIKWDEDNLTTEAHCSCDCEFLCKHTCAVILAIRNKKMKKFYKLSYKDNNLYEQVFNFNYILCFGIEGNHLKLLSQEGVLDSINVLDKFGNCPWQVLEDDKNKTLTKEILTIKKSEESGLKKYRYAYVVFQDELRKHYYYLDEIGTEKCDVVIVERNEECTIAYVVNVVEYYEDNLPCPIKDTKKILHVLDSDISKEEFLMMEL